MEIDMYLTLYVAKQGLPIAYAEALLFASLQIGEDIS
jgi:hypothetical protein